MTEDIIDVEHEEIVGTTGMSQMQPGTDLVPAAPQPPANLFHADTPGGVVERATETANALKDVIQQKKLFKRIGDKDHVLVEGWTLLGTMLGVFPVTVWSRQVEGGWEARAEARTMNGAVVGAAEAQCTRSESKWKNRDEYAIRSMAQTRATSKALRQPLGFVMTLAGYDATPADEMADTTQHHAAPPAATEAWASEGDMRAIGLTAELLQNAYPDAAGPGKTWREVAHQYAQEKLGVSGRYTKKQAVDTADWLEAKFKELSDGVPFEPEVPPEAQEEIEAIADNIFHAPEPKDAA